METIGTATYSPEDNKLRLYPFARLDTETYQRVKAAGFSWAPKQELFVAPMWTPGREDLLIEMCGEIGDEDKSLVNRAEERAERFEEYSDKRENEAERAHAAVDEVAKRFEGGQPILVGHHSERRARKDAERIENGMRKALDLWKTSKYWEQRAAGAIHHAKYKERPDVRARRIKGIEADKRKAEKIMKESNQLWKFWRGELVNKSGQIIEVNRESALHFCNYYDHTSRCFPLDQYPRQSPASQYEGSMSLWSALGGSDGPEHMVCTVEQARDIAITRHARTVEHYSRWIAHYENRLIYEKAMLADSGGTVADQRKPEKGGACKCWASPRGGWSIIQKVNKVSVTVLDNWGNGGRDFTRTIPFDNLPAIMTKAEVDAARGAGLLVGETALGFGLLVAPKEEAPKPLPQDNGVRVERDDKIRQLQETIKAGVQVVSAPQLFPTPPEIAERMVELAEIKPGHTVLEPSAGTGNIAKAIRDAEPMAHLDCNEINPQLCSILKKQGFEVTQYDFLDFRKPYCPDSQDGHDRIIMNPPFENGADIKHIRHALTMLKPGGKIVALCANGPRQREAFMGIADYWEDLPAGSFKEQGTNVNVALMVLEQSVA